MVLWRSYILSVFVGNKEVSKNQFIHPVITLTLSAASPEIPLLLPEPCSGLSIREGQAQGCSCNPNSLWYHLPLLCHNLFSSTKVCLSWGRGEMVLTHWAAIADTWLLIAPHTAPGMSSCWLWALLGFSCALCCPVGNGRMERYWEVCKEDEHLPAVHLNCQSASPPAAQDRISVLWYPGGFIPHPLQTSGDWAVLSTSPVVITPWSQPEKIDFCSSPSFLTLQREEAVNALLGCLALTLTSNLFVMVSNAIVEEMSSGYVMKHANKIYIHQTVFPGSHASQTEREDTLQRHLIDFSRGQVSLIIWVSLDVADYQTASLAPVSGSQQGNLRCEEMVSGI